MNRSLTVPVPMAGKVLGLKSEEGAYEHVSKHLQVITLGKLKRVVIAQQLANFLTVPLDTLWQTIDEIEQRDKAEEPARQAKREADKLAADKRKAELIDKRIAGDPAGRAFDRAASKAAA